MFPVKGDQVNTPDDDVKNGGEEDGITDRFERQSIEGEDQEKDAVRSQDDDEIDSIPFQIGAYDAYPFLHITPPYIQALFWL